MGKGGIIGKPNNPSITLASGIWGLREQSQARKTGNWPGFEATGGTITESGGYRVHTFTTTGSFVVTYGQRTVEYLVVAGGGGGGKRHGGGGGAGGFVAGSVLANVNSYSIVVGGGGAGAGPGAAPSPASQGSNSTAFGKTAIGGGGGGSFNSTLTVGGNGGSGGGASIPTSGALAGGSTTAIHLI